MNKLSRVGIDLAKNVFQLHGVDRHGKVVWRRRLTRDKWLKALLEKVEPSCEIGMEACAGAHHWARELQAEGFTVKLVAPQQLAQLRAAAPVWLEDAENGLTSRFRRLLNNLWDDLKTLDQRVAELDHEINMIAQSDPVAKRLQQLRGVGPMVATALVATVGNAEQFANGRQMAASLGLTPKQHSSGGKDRLLGISKRGDAYLRSILIHGARAVIRTAKEKDDRLSQWVTSLAARRHPNVAAAALANKTVRIAWAMLRRGTDYQPDRIAA